MLDLDIEHSEHVGNHNVSNSKSLVMASRASFIAIRSATRKSFHINKHMVIIASTKTEWVSAEGKLPERLDVFRSHITCLLRTQEERRSVYKPEVVTSYHVRHAAEDYPIRWSVGVSRIAATKSFWDWPLTNSWYCYLVFSCARRSILQQTIGHEIKCNSLAFIELHFHERFWWARASI